MIEEEATGVLDFDALRHAIEGADPDALLGFYSEDAGLRIVHASLPDGAAFELKGRSQIERYLHAVCDQQVERHLEGEAVREGDRISFTEECEYPEGSRIRVKTILEIEEGLIQHQLDVVEGRS
jgi:SnoaL-like domain